MKPYYVHIDVYYWCAILIAHQLFWQNVEPPVSIFRTLQFAGEPSDRLFHIHSAHSYQLCLYKMYLTVYVNKRLQPLTKTRYNLMVPSSLLKMCRRSFKHRRFLCALHSWGERSQLCRRGCRSTTSSYSNTLLRLIYDKACIEVYAIKCHSHTWKLN